VGQTSAIGNYRQRQTFWHWWCQSNQNKVSHYAALTPQCSVAHEATYVCLTDHVGCTDPTREEAHLKCEPCLKQGRHVVDGDPRSQCFVTRPDTLSWPGHGATHGDWRRPDLVVHYPGFPFKLLGLTHLDYQATVIWPNNQIPYPRVRHHGHLAQQPNSVPARKAFRLSSDPPWGPGRQLAHKVV
jgi:hypothetical protein